ncbi:MULTISPECIES: hypothetical protein [Furfurilactobacillus]|uniref:HEPN domain-containing protein n=1 Tax=Furfurilactobacillus rossiae TaxID=231049 RepID=A0A7C9IV66_9LACO|nr:hypothetical protein [Furfurilactobacillus milii]MYV06121.1 hypothetical protein [Furfurilactobacillus milii]
MVDVQDSVNRLMATANDHFTYIQAGHDFIRAWAIQFELAYTDYRTIDLALQFDGTDSNKLRKDFVSAYQAVYRFEYPFAVGGLEQFDEQCENQMPDYEVAVNQLDEVLEKVRQVDNSVA